MVAKKKPADVLSILDRFCAQNNRHKFENPELYFENYKIYTEPTKDGRTHWYHKTSIGFLSENYDKFSESHKDEEWKGSFLHHNLDTQRLKTDITNKEQHISFLFEMDDKKIEIFFGLLSHTEQALIYQKQYSEPYKENVDKQNKIFTVIEIVKTLKYFDDEDKQICLNVLEYMADTILDKHYTERQAYQDFLYRLHFFVFDGSSKYKTLKYANQILKKYFQAVNPIGGYLNFSKQTNFETFKKHNYTYEAGGILLYHSK